MSEHVSLSASEWKVMEALWEQAPRTIMELTAALEPSTGWSKHTVISFLGRMEKKGAVTYTETGRAKAYAPAYPKEEATAEETERFLDRVFGGSLGLMVNSLVEGKSLTDRDIAELMDILEKAKGGGDGA